MNRIRSMTMLALAGGLLHAGWNAVRRAALARRVAAARAPDRHALELPGMHSEDLESYQDLLDESLNLTFPASDPICAQAATRCGDPVATQANAADWRLHPGSKDAASHAAPAP